MEEEEEEEEVFTGDIRLAQANKRYVLSSISPLGVLDIVFHRSQMCRLNLRYWRVRTQTQSPMARPSLEVARQTHDTQHFLTPLP